jgi:hypothetical protein
MNARSQRAPSAPRGQTGGAPAAPGGASPSSEWVARLVSLDPGFYALSLAAKTRWREPVAGFAVPAVHVGPPPDHDDLEVTDASGQPASWLGGRSNMLLVKAPRGGRALVTAYLPRNPDEKPVEIVIRRLDPGHVTAGKGGLADLSAGAGGGLPPIATLRLGGAAPAQGSTQVSCEILAHIRSRGDLRFSDFGWAGRLGRGQWIEAFTVTPRSRTADSAFEYKGLVANGAETPWIVCGSPCGTRGRGMPLLGFAIRQRALPDGGQIDCEYAGYFQSGVTAGPFRNGAPCRSPRDNDPLEGMQVRIALRPPRARAEG